MNVRLSRAQMKRPPACSSFVFIAYRAKSGSPESCFLFFFSVKFLPFGGEETHHFVKLDCPEKATLKLVWGLKRTVMVGISHKSLEIRLACCKPILDSLGNPRV